jgi:hypothetical protein
MRFINATRSWSACFLHRLLPPGIRPVRGDSRYPRCKDRILHFRVLVNILRLIYTTFGKSCFVSKVRGEWRKLRNGEIHNSYSSRDIIRQIKLRRMRRAGHVARMGGGRNLYKVLMGKRAGK